LVPLFALFYVVLAPFVGAVADAWPKGQVMLVSNGIKIVGCLMMLFGGHPLLAYAIVARVTVELILVIFRIAEKIAPLDENAPQAEDVLSKLKK
jgi:predicted MFS family arabinose efflux permease